MSVRQVEVPLPDFLYWIGQIRKEYMTNKQTELSKREKASIQNLVTKECANYDSEYGCLALDGECYMKTIGFKDSPLCPYFVQCVLPLDPHLEVSLMGGNIGTCKHCGKRYSKVGKIQYCSQRCREEAARINGRNRTRKCRSNKAKV